MAVRLAKANEWSFVRHHKSHPHTIETEEEDVVNAQDTLHRS